jgi:NTE family protein
MKKALLLAGAAVLLADGDLTSPLPVRVARSLGARRVVAVDVSADPAVAPFDEIPIAWTAEAVTRRALIDAEAPGADVIVRPRLPYYVPHTRAYKEMAMRRGEEAARAALPRLKALAEAGR